MSQKEPLSSQASQVSPSVNRLVLLARLVATEPLRYTPAGMPVLEFTYFHESVVDEAGKPRLIKFESSGRALGPVALQISKVPLGSDLKMTGFIAPSSHKSNKLRFHLQSID